MGVKAEAHQNQKVNKGSGEGEAYMGRPRLFFGHHIDEEADRQDRQEKIDNEHQYLSHNRTFNERLVTGQGRDVGYGGAGDLAQCFPCQERLV